MSLKKQQQIIPRLGGHKYFPKDLWVRTEGVITRNSNKELLLYNKNKTNHNCCQDTEPEQKLLLIILKVLQDLQEGEKKWKVRPSEKGNTWGYLEDLRAGTDVSIL